LWSHDIRVDKGHLQGSTLDISALPSNVEIFDITGNRVQRAKEIRLSPFPLFVRGVVGSTAALAGTPGPFKSRKHAAPPAPQRAGWQATPGNPAEAG